ncbi:MAG: protein-L-isoaspartate(D-aspartate) O-methyltransferase, partial [Bdellovibrionia bacterium]
MRADFARQREKMVIHQIAARGIHDGRVLEAMWEIRREDFLPEFARAHAYDDNAIGIGEGQTISQPLIVAMMSSALELKGHEKVLEVGAGSGYGAAVLARLAREVYALERNPVLSQTARAHLKTAGILNVKVICSDGNFGWMKAAPFDAISVTAGAVGVPQPLLDQLSMGGRLVIPVGPDRDAQQLLRITK